MGKKRLGWGVGGGRAELCGFGLWAWAAFRGVISQVTYWMGCCEVYVEDVGLFRSRCGPLLSVVWC